MMYANVVINVNNQYIAYINTDTNNELIRTKMKKFNVPVHYGYATNNMLIVTVNATLDIYKDMEILDTLKQLVEVYR